MRFLTPQDHRVRFLTLMSLCILTDATALSNQAAMNGGKFVFTIKPKTDPPNLQDYLQVFTDLEREFNAILVLAGSDAIFSGLEIARLAAQCHGGSARIEVLDTLQIGYGLSILAQLAARKAAAGMGLQETLGYVRAVIPTLFTIICPENLPERAGAGTYAAGLSRAVPYAQEEKSILKVPISSISGNTGEPADRLLPVYELEEGLLTPYKKARSQRHLLEIFQEFLEEFETPQQVCFFHGKNASLHIRPLRESILALFSGTQFIDLELMESTHKFGIPKSGHDVESTNKFGMESTHKFSSEHLAGLSRAIPYAAGLFGEHTAGLTVLEMPGERGYGK